MSFGLSVNPCQNLIKKYKTFSICRFKHYNALTSSSSSWFLLLPFLCPIHHLGSHKIELVKKGKNLFAPTESANSLEPTDATKQNVFHKALLLLWITRNQREERNKNELPAHFNWMYAVFAIACAQNNFFDLNCLVELQHFIECLQRIQRRTTKLEFHSSTGIRIKMFSSCSFFPRAMLPPLQRIESVRNQRSFLFFFAPAFSCEAIIVQHLHRTMAFSSYDSLFFSYIRNSSTENALNQFMFEPNIARTNRWNVFHSRSDLWWWFSLFALPSKNK